MEIPTITVANLNTKTLNVTPVCLPLILCHAKCTDSVRIGNYGEKKIA